VGEGSKPVVLSSTKHHGLVPSDAYFSGRTIYSNDLSNYKRVDQNWFAYATNHLAEGSIGLQREFDTACVSPIYTVFECKDSVDPGFLYRVLKSPGLVSAYRVHEQASVDRRGAVRFGDFSKICIELPYSLAEQQRITEILDLLDSRIASVGRVSGKLRAMYSAITDKLIDRIEEPARPLKEFLAAKPHNGFSPMELESWTGVVALGLGCLTANGFVPRQLKNIPAKDPRYAESWVSDGDLLMSRANTLELVGLSGRYKDVGTPCVYPDLMMKLVPNALVLPAYLEIILRSNGLRRQLRRIAQGTSESMAKISAASVMELSMRIPDLTEQDRILRAVTDGNSQTESVEEEKSKLVLLKQGLMDDLLTGRVRVTDGGVECGRAG